MTLCIAAECLQPNRPFRAVVFAADFQVEGEMARADIGQKIALLPHEDFPVLMAGTQTRALELTSAISHFLGSAASKLGEEYVPPQWDAVFTEALLNQKMRIAHEIVSSRFGIPYTDFVKNGKEWFPEDIFRDTINTITQASLDCYLIVVAFSQTTPKLYRISPNATVETCENFAAIGSGYYIAESCLYQRSQHAGFDLGTTIYNVYEAMRLGSKAPGVGDHFQIGVAEWEYWGTPTNEGNVKLSYLKPQYYSYLEGKFMKYGPRPLAQVGLRPRLLKEQQRAIVLTPKGEHDPEVIKQRERAKASRERGAQKRSAKLLAATKSAAQ